MVTMLALFVGLAERDVLVSSFGFIDQIIPMPAP